MHEKVKRTGSTVGNLLKKSLVGDCSYGTFISAAEDASFCV
jgi:hypothetical protein